MSRLTPFSRFLITLLIVGGIFLAVRQFLPQLTEKFNKKGGQKPPSNMLCFKNYFISSSKGIIIIASPCFILSSKEA